MKRTVILDTGPLVALLDASERNHSWAGTEFEGVNAPAFSCEAVVTEACFLLRGRAGGADAVLEAVTKGLIDVSFNAGAVMKDIRQLMTRYRDVPMSFADACLVRMSEERTGVAVMTLDAHFRLYRRLGRQVIPLVTPSFS